MVFSYIEAATDKVKRKEIEGERIISYFFAQAETARLQCESLLVRQREIKKGIA